MKDIVEEAIKLIQLEKLNLTEMARIGFTDDGFEVYVNTDDGGNIPHFHYRTKSTWQFHSCIRLDTAEYFHHDGKEGVLNSNQRKDLVKFLNSYDKNEEDKTHWQVLLREWNRNNLNIDIDINQVMPDYTQLR